MDKDTGDKCGIDDNSGARVASADRGDPGAWFAVLGAALAPAVCVWVFRSEILHHSADLASNALSLAAISVLVALLALRPLIRVLTRRRILLLYCAVSATVGISTMNMVQFLITTLLSPWWFARPENRYSEFLDKIPAWAAPGDPAIVRGMFEGHTSLYADGVWQKWLLPMGFWSVFLLSLLGAQWCLAHLFYQRWARAERLTFPVARIPLQLTEVRGSARYGLAIGAAIAAGIQGVNALHVVFPAVPAINVLPVEVAAGLASPWNQMGALWITLYPCIIGLSYLVPSHILLSCVLFFWLTRLENLGGFVLGLRGQGGAGVGFPYQAEQAQGAAVALALAIVWSARRELAQSVRSRGDRGVWVLLLVSSAALVASGISLGMRPATSLMLIGLFLALMVGAGWIRAAVGLVWNPGNDVSWWPRTLLGAGVTPGEGVGLAYMRWFTFGDFRAHALPAYVDVFHISERGGISRPLLMRMLAAASVLSVLASLWTALDVYHRYGIASALTDQWRTYQGRITFELLRSYLDGFIPRPGWDGMAAAAAGGGIVLGLYAASLRVVWWPLHPAGFVAAQTGTLDWLWLPMLIAWMLKGAVTRAGGLPMYRRALPIFIGLVLGDFVISALLTILAWIVGAPMYKPFPI